MDIPISSSLIYIMFKIFLVSFGNLVPLSSSSFSYFQDIFLACQSIKYCTVARNDLEQFYKFNDRIISDSLSTKKDEHHEVWNIHKSNAWLTSRPWSSDDPYSIFLLHLILGILCSYMEHFHYWCEPKACFAFVSSLYWKSTIP